MATISSVNNEKVYTIAKWGGLNEHPDGDTRLKLGEASKMSNWKITRDGNLKRRPGSEMIFGLSASFTAEISPDIIRLRTFEFPTDPVTVFDEISTEQVPGKITVVSRSGGVEKGTWKTTNTTVVNGVLTESLTSPYTIEAGILRLSSDLEGINTTVAGLQEMLAELDPGEYLYYFNEEATYALANDAIQMDGSHYLMSGYLVSAVPSSQGQPVNGLWFGYAGSKKCVLAASGGKIWSLYDPDNDIFKMSYIGAINTDNHVNFIPFDGKVYIQNGVEYYVYDGSSLSTVTGYIPLVAISIGPELNGTPVDAGELLEPVNRLINKRRVWISPDGTGTIFDLPEKDLKSIDSVTDLTTGTAVSTGWSGDTTNGKVTFSTAPAKAVNKYEIGYTVHVPTDTGYSTMTNYRKQVTDCLYAELYAGSQDTMLCFYGDGTNKFIYSGMDENGVPRADYFPDQYEALIGDSNTPITSLIRHGGALLAYKTNETWACSYGQVTLANDQITDAFYIQPVNRDKGNMALGQVRLVDNNPVSCSGTELYQWINSSYYTSNLTRDERQARRISDRIQRSVKELDFEKCIMWDDDDNQEFYIVGNGVALIWNYVADAWYRYDNFDAVTMCNFNGEVLIGTSEGNVIRLTDRMTTDLGRPILADWESGAIDFGASNMRKYSSMLWVGLKPVDGTSVDVCVETDRKNTFREKIISSTKAKIPGEPFMVRSKIKAKKFVYYRLLLSVDEIMPAVTVTNVDFRVRQTGYAK